MRSSKGCQKAIHATDHAAIIKNKFFQLKRPVISAKLISKKPYSNIKIIIIGIPHGWYLSLVLQLGHFNFVGSPAFMIDHIPISILQLGHNLPSIFITTFFS